MIIGRSKLQLQDVRAIVRDNPKIGISEDLKTAITDCFCFLESFSKDKVIYGINTGFGPMAQWRIDENHLK